MTGEDSQYLNLKKTFPTEKIQTYLKKEIQHFLQ